MGNDQDVNIRINETRSGNAVSEEMARIEALKAKVEEMRRVEDNYRAKGMSSAATSVKAERAPLERELKGLQQAELANARAVTREHREREAIERARASRRNRIIGAGAGLAENLAGGSPLGGISGAVGSLGGGPAMIAAAVVAAVGAGLNLYFSENRADRADEITQTERRAGSAHERSKRLKYGGVGEFSGALQSTEDEIAANLRQREMLEEQAKPKWYDPRNWSNNLFGTDFQTFGGARALKQNREEGDRLIGQRGAERSDLDKRVNNELKPMIEAQERMNRGDANGARAMQDKVTYLQKYREVLNATKGDAATAQRAAEAEISTIQRERAGSFAGLIGSRTSGAAAARVATIAAAQTQVGPRDASTGELLMTIKDQHADAKNSSRMKDFTRGGLNSGGLQAGHL